MRAARSAAAWLTVCTLIAMAYDQEFAGHIRQLLGSDPELTEKEMFGGLSPWRSRPRRARSLTLSVRISCGRARGAPGGILHAKAVIADDEPAFVTSANLTEAESHDRRGTFL
jgi:phosphatidylserine/phosphatidylglycerophosphate/cardiolipin synthase-like enzyme